MQVIPVLVLIGVGALLFFLEKRAKPIPVPDLPKPSEKDKYAWEPKDEEYVSNILKASRKGNATKEMIKNALNLVRTRYPWKEPVIEELKYILEIMERYPRE